MCHNFYAHPLMASSIFRRPNRVFFLYRLFGSILLFLFLLSPLCEYFYQPPRNNKKHRARYCCKNDCGYCVFVCCFHFIVIFLIVIFKAAPIQHFDRSAAPQKLIFYSPQSFWAIFRFFSASLTALFAYCKDIE